VSLRLRILFLIAAVNVAVLLLVAKLGAASTAEASPVGTGAILEALHLAHADRPADVPWHAVRCLVRRQQGGREFEIYGPAADRDHLKAISERLQRKAEEGTTGFELDSDGLAAVHAMPRSGEWTAFYVGFNEEARREAFSALRSIYLLLAAGVLALILVTYLVLDRLVLRPLAQLGLAARAVAEGQAAPPVPAPTGRSEMANLIHVFNRMTQEVREYQGHLEARVLDALRRVGTAENRLVVAQRLAATGTLAAGFAHEINNPLGGILNALRKLRDADLKPDKREEYFALVLEGFDRIRTIVQRILHFTPRQREPAPLDAAEVCRKAVELASHRAEQRGVGLFLDAAEPVRGVVGDSQELTQAVLNLILNAVDAIPEGRAGRVSVAARRQDRRVVLEVRDDGVGMDEETVRRCVDLFFSTKPEGQGSGLGLGIVQHIATDHGGTLAIDSARGEGTTVRILLPVGDAA